MTPKLLNYLLFGIGIGLLIQPATQLARGQGQEAAPFLIIGLALVGTAQWGYVELAHRWAHGVAEGS